MDGNICLASEGPFKMWFCKGCMLNDYNTVTGILLDNAYLLCFTATDGIH